MSHGEATAQSLQRIREAFRSHLPETTAPQGSSPHPGELVDEAEFWLRVRQEIERSDGSGRPFAVFVITSRPPLDDGSPASLVAAVKPPILRACDCFALFEDELAVAVLLPETQGDGAGTVIERLKSQVGEPEGVDVWLAEYPRERQKLTDYIAQAG